MSDQPSVMDRAGAENLPGEFVADPARGLCYFYGETTADGWHLGEVPPGYRGLSPERIQPITISPEPKRTA